MSSCIVKFFRPSLLKPRSNYLSQEYSRRALPRQLPSRRHSSQFRTILSSTDSVNNSKNIGNLVTSLRRYPTNAVTPATSADAPTSSPPSPLPAFDLNVAVLMAGFAFDAYKTPDSSLGYTQWDVTGCDTLYVSKEFLNEWYTGQLTVKVVKGSKIPDVDFLGNSDPYVVIESADGFGKTKVIGGESEPVWNETFSLLITSPSVSVLKVTAKDTNKLSSDKPLGEGTITLKDYCDGKNHTIDLKLTGENEGGILTLEVQYQSFEEIEKTKPQPTPVQSISQEEKEKIQKLFETFMGTPNLSTTDFVKASISGLQIPETTKQETTIENGEKITEAKIALEQAGWKPSEESSSSTESSTESSTWKADVQSVIDGVKSGGEAEKLNILENLTAESVPKTETETEMGKLTTDSVPESQTAASVSVFQKTDALVASYALVKATEEQKIVKPTTEEEEQMLKDLFATAESTAEAWTLLASSLGQTSFVKSEFVKICFVQNQDTDTQAIIWRNLTKKRLVVAFRGTERTRALDVITDLRAIPTWDDGSLVHRGFAASLSSIKDRLLYGIQNVLESESSQPGEGRWQVWFTGHSLGAALATLFVKEWAESPLGKSGKYDIKMYNFGSPRVGNQTFVDQYSALVKDSWRVVNLRDIVPTVPKIIGYKHVPTARIVEAVSDSEGKTPEEEQKEDDQLAEYLYGDSNILQNLLNTQTAIAATIKDGSALSMHMENYYYLALLQEVKTQLATQSKALTAAK